MGACLISSQRAIAFIHLETEKPLGREDEFLADRSGRAIAPTCARRPAHALFEAANIDAGLT